MPIRMAKIQNTGNTKCWWDVEQQELSFVTGGNAKSCIHFERQFASVLQDWAYSYHMIQQ